MAYDIDGNAALVTASSSGLGRATAEVFVREGANVVINGRDRTRLQEAREQVAEVGPGEVVAQAGDLTEAEAITELVDTAVDEFGGLDHLVTSSGGPPSGLFLDTGDDDWYEAFDLLVMSVVRLVREAATHLQTSDRGTIVNITSGSVKEAKRSLVLSNSVRMSVVGLEKTISKELAPSIRANTVLPSSIETSRVRELIQAAVERGDYDSYQAGVEGRAENIPIGRLGDPLELAELVVFLSSPRSSYISGAAIPVDGGASSSNL